MPALWGSVGVSGHPPLGVARRVCTKEAMDLSKCYLHTLGPSEAEKLAELRKLVPSIVAKAKEESPELQSSGNPPTIWKVDVQADGDASDIVLLKFLRAEELDVAKAAERVSTTLVFRADCCIDELAEAEMPEHFQGHDFICDSDRDGRPVLISRFGGMDLPKVFGNAEEFVRYRAQFMERTIARLKFEKGLPEDLCQVHDYSGVPLVFQQAEVKQGVTAVSKVFADHYPEMKGKTVFVNFPTAFAKLWQAFSLMIPERTRSKFIILGSGDHAQLFEHVAPEVLPESLGGMSRTPPGRLSGPCKVVSVRPRTIEDMELCQVTSPATVAWEVRVCMAEAAYEVAFVPAGEGEETILQKSDEDRHLLAEDGVAAGEWKCTAQAGGTVRVRLRNKCAWFKARICICRAEVVE